MPEGFTILQEELTEANFQFNRLTGQAVNLLETNKELNVQLTLPENATITILKTGIDPRTVPYNYYASDVTYVSWSQS